MRAITTEINRIAIEAIDAAMSEARFDDRNVTLNDFHIELDIILRGYEIENVQMFKTAVELTAQSLCPKFFDFVRPPMYMDEDGNYTSDPSRWA